MTCEKEKYFPFIEVSANVTDTGSKHQDKTYTQKTKTLTLKHENKSQLHLLYTIVYIDCNYCNNQMLGIVILN